VKILKNEDFQYKLTFAVEGPEKVFMIESLNKNGFPSSRGKDRTDSDCSYILCTPSEGAKLSLDPIKWDHFLTYYIEEDADVSSLIQANHLQRQISIVRFLNKLKGEKND